MAQFGWAYVNCSDVTASSGQAAGPTGSLQFLTGANSTSGSNSLVFFTSSFGSYSANTLLVSGTLVVQGTITASSFVIDQTNVVSGSTIFGNSNDDTHRITGSLYVGGSGSSVPSTFQVIPATSQSVTLGARYNYRSIATSGFTSSTGDYIIGIGGSGDLEFRINSAATHGSGSVLIIKDQTNSRTGTITLSASAPNQIDNAGFYELSGTMPAISLYSNGANWYVF
jgi:hypothetical protein